MSELGEDPLRTSLMETVDALLEKVEVVPFEATLLVVERILQLPLGAANDPASLRGHCAKASIPFVASGSRKDSMPVLQLRLLRHELKASISTVESPRPETAPKLMPDLARACTVGWQAEPPPPFASPARRPHVPTQPQSAPAALAAEKTQTTKRRAKSSISRRRAKKVKENVFSSDKDLTDLRAHRIGDASAILDVLQPSIDALPWESVYAEDGCVLQLGRKYYALYTAAKYVAAGWEVLVSSAVAEFVFDTSGRAIRNLWENFAPEQSFAACMSKRGMHPKMQDLLENVQTQINCRAWLDEHSEMKGAQRSSPLTFAAWLNDTELPSMLQREKDSHRPIGVLVAQERKRKVQLPLHGISAVQADASAALPNPDVALGAAVLEAIAAKERLCVSEDTAARYMRRLGYTRSVWRKGTFFDGHDREDVVRDRMLYLAEKLEHDQSTLHKMPTTEEQLLYTQLAPADRPFIEIVHDESACNANDGIRFQYVHTSKSAKLRSKSNGAGLMSSAFITEVLGGVMKDAEAVAAETLEYGKGVWWNSAKMLAQLRKVIALRNRLFPWARCIWRFDHSSNHKAKSEDALNVHRMSIGPGGKQPLMRSTRVLDDCRLKGQLQSLVFEAPHPRAGQAKGLKQVLDERWGPEVAAAFKGKTRKKQLQLRLLRDQDFNLATTLIHDLLAELCPADICRFYPKFHCEFSPIERFWSDHKRFCRTYCKGNITGLRTVVPQGFDAVCGDSVQRYFGLCRRYEAAYRCQNIDTKNVDRVVRAYTSHRKVLDSTLQSELIASLSPGDAATLQGLCHCHTCVLSSSICAQPCCAVAKTSVCTAPRCAEHGSVRGDSKLVLSSLAASEAGAAESKFEEDDEDVQDEEEEEEEKEKDEEETTMVACRLKTCRRWRRVPLEWYSVFKGGNVQFTCDAAGRECKSKCCKCNNVTCKCRCETCNKIKSCVCLCARCDARINECECESDSDASSQSDEAPEAVDAEPEPEQEQPSQTEPNVLERMISLRRRMQAGTLVEGRRKQ